MSSRGAWPAYAWPALLLPDRVAPPAFPSSATSRYAPPAWQKTSTIPLLGPHRPRGRTRKENDVNDRPEEKGKATNEQGAVLVIDVADPARGDDPNEFQGYDHGAGVSFIVVCVHAAARSSVSVARADPASLRCARFEDAPSRTTRRRMAGRCCKPVVEVRSPPLPLCVVALVLEPYSNAIIREAPEVLL